MTKFKLPKGYSFAPPDEGDDPSILVGGQRLYGGADISDAWDADGTHWTWCLATGPDGKFRYRAFAQPKGAAAYTERPLPDSVDGRGNADVQWYDGKAHYSAWQGQQFYQNPVPGFVAFPSIPSLTARLAALEAGGGGDGGGRVAIVIAADSPLGRLYVGPPYLPEHFDTPEETAKRMQKLLEALLHVRALLIATGVARME